MSELILQTRDLTRRYGHTLALDHAALSVEKGQIFGLVGRNGAGKTTLIRLISGQSNPTAGEITLFGASTPAALARARSSSRPVCPNSSTDPSVGADWPVTSRIRVVLPAPLRPTRP